ncbi:chlorophyllase/cutinase-like alpha/beta fold protein [Prosthecobacter sp.]|uniref:poly(ethylene terephthalate) hydrolase family protein n=1 Tax=Prosthecobacter sp. TaxID=1965333 RepID=UPI0037853090
MKRLLHHWRFLVLAFAALVIVGSCANRAPTLPVPKDVVKRTEKLVLQGREVPVDLYLPQNVAKAPVVIVAHGFTRNRQVMAGWGNLLAQNGMIAVVPNLPFFTHHTRNARAINDLITLVHTPGHLTQPAPSDAVAIMGHSAGGYAAVLAASHEKHLRCWIGLDPVDFGDHALKTLPSVQSPGLMLLAEPGAWNRQANAVPWLNHAAAPLTALRIHHSTHCDSENPSTPLARFVCGETAPERLAIYETYALAMLRHHLFGDAASADVLKQAAQDHKVSVLTAPDATKTD